ncbi:fumarylacetoacetate hydrolase family protein [Pusillimonas noertemannii]|uniref:2-keto-4-pentenoate hydratase/2-oxohepta-3-ene-1,7-dioic acid hydratase in catechol pathway n=1 Tax=Pusillimonas noertemannii TaxID=305977 RepID=A0A2U1CQA8_9BURK|nr:fumarylacetoacetate hydrolase family protein [Pusillimonas noertemannii]NYT67409.1 fumarylacetoacetate hydrolase family protein [Pusillimonas noertemannii]PVY68082.1 2-keto-4-pentenoate hydratase/2-oxohepta-3-ene-1,7-dioic acid hydratase in catechol pathway [Pusillimonas noertemannii]TFL12409.1 FAA hydrolase family protein [Pusillimonas noertemannii]
MKLCRFDDDRLGVIEGDQVLDITTALDVIPASTYPLPRHDPLIAHLDEVCARARQLMPDAPRKKIDQVKLLSPVANPGKLVAAPVNYLKHLEEARADSEIHHNSQVIEIQRIGLFLKATSSLIGASQPVSVRHHDRRNDHEIELAIIIGKPGTGIKKQDAWDHIAAYTIGLDMTVRGPEERSLRKSVDSYSVLGPWMVTADEMGDATNLDFQLTVNGETRQKANTRDLVLNIPELVEYASSFYTLHPGDVIYTGTPEGVGPVKPGDTIVAEFEKIGRMQVAVTSA